MREIYEGAYIIGWILILVSILGVIGVLARMWWLSSNNHYVESYKPFWGAIMVLIVLGFVGEKAADFGAKTLDRQEQQEQAKENPFTR